MSDELDRAIKSAQEIVALTSKAFDGAPYGSPENSRTYARALVAELLRGMDGSDLNAISPAMVYGFNAALAEIKRRAGLEGEG